MNWRKNFYELRVLCNCSCMGVYTLQEISRKNYHGALGASPRRCYHNPWGMFLVARTCPCINKFITHRNHKMNERWLRRWQTVLKRSTSNSLRQRPIQVPGHYVRNGGKPWDKQRWTAHLNRLVSNLLQQCFVQEPRHHFYACTDVLRA